MVLLYARARAGTFHEALNGLMSRPDRLVVPICVIPAGTGNTFAYDLGFLSHMDSVEALLRVRQRCPRPAAASPCRAHPCMFAFDAQGRLRAVDVLEISDPDAAPSNDAVVSTDLAMQLKPVPVSSGAKGAAEAEEKAQQAGGEVELSAVPRGGAAAPVAAEAGQRAGAQDEAGEEKKEEQQAAAPVLAPALAAQVPMSREDSTTLGGAYLGAEFVPPSAEPVPVDGAASSPAAAPTPSRQDAGTAAATAATTTVTTTAATGQRGNVLYSMNLVGWGLSTAVLHTANRLRWMGGAQVCAAPRRLCACRVTHVARWWAVHVCWLPRAAAQPDVPLRD